MHVGTWLQRIGLPQYEQAFAEHAIDASILAKLTEQDLGPWGNPDRSPAQAARRDCCLAWHGNLNGSTSRISTDPGRASGNYAKHGDGRRSTAELDPENETGG